MGSKEFIYFHSFACYDFEFRVCAIFIMNDNFMRYIVIILYFQLFGGIVACRYRNLMDPLASGLTGTPFAGGI